MQSNGQALKYYKHREIDFDRWNTCVEHADNCRVYAYNWHLDRTAVEWDALIWGDYEYVMPLPIRKKFGIKYIYQPLFSQQLGIFPSPPQAIAELFFQFLAKKIRYSDFQLNSANPFTTSGDKIKFIERKNYILPLSSDYETLRSAYSSNTKRNINKAKKNGLSLIRGIRLEAYMAFKKQHLIAKLSNQQLGILKSLVAYGQYKGFGEIYGVYDKNNSLCAAVYFCRWKDRLTYMNAASSEKGKETGAMAWLVDQVIRDFSGKNMILDFEGSMIPGVARFYAGFGARAENYFQLKINRLPLPLKWLKP